MEDEHKKCPVCAGILRTSPRYPRAVCRDCYTRAVSLDGRTLRFHNQSFSGGFIALYEDGTEYKSHFCKIGEHLCYADEAYLGGIVIETHDGPVPPRKN